MPDVLLVGVSPIAVGALREYGALAAARLTAAPGPAPDPAPGGLDPDAVVLGPAVVTPIAAAQDAHRRWPDAALVLAVEPATIDEVRRGLQYAPYLPADVAVLPWQPAGTDHDELGGEVERAVQRVAQQRRYRALIAAASLRLGAEPHRGPRHSVPLGALLDNAPVGVLLADTAGRLQAWNPDADGLLALADRGPGCDVADLFRDPTLVRALLDRAATTEVRHSLTTHTSSGRRAVEVFAVSTCTDRGDPAVLVLLRDLSGQERAERERDVATERLAFLADTTASLDATVGADATARELTRRLVPHVADACLIVLAEAPFTRVASAVGVEVAGEVPAALDRAARSGEELLALDGGGLLAGVPAHSEACLPLPARGGVVGALYLAQRASRRRFTPTDLAFLRDLARRAAVAVHNARLVSELSRTAHTLQRALLPPERFVLPGVDVAARYLPGAEGVEVGGDFYDVLPLGDDRLFLAVGDVMGRGVRAAATMGQVRTAVRAYALDGHRPGDVLDRLEPVLATGSGPSPDDQLVTCVCAELHPPSGRLWVASAGHLPPLIVRGGDAAYLPVPPGLPVGVGGSDHPLVTAELPTDALLVLYTDGLVERRDESLETGLRHLQVAAAAAPSAAEAACDHLLVAMGRRDGHDDDVALLALRRR